MTRPMYSKWLPLEKIRYGGLEPRILIRCTPLTFMKGSEGTGQTDFGDKTHVL